MSRRSAVESARTSRQGESSLMGSTTTTGETRDCDPRKARRRILKTFLFCFSQACAKRTPRSQSRMTKQQQRRRRPRPVSTLGRAVFATVPWTFRTEPPFSSQIDTKTTNPMTRLRGRPNPPSFSAPKTPTVLQNSTTPTMHSSTATRATECITRNVTLSLYYCFREGNGTAYTVSPDIKTKRVRPNETKRTRASWNFSDRHPTSPSPNSKGTGNNQQLMPRLRHGSNN